MTFPIFCELNVRADRDRAEYRNLLYYCMRGHDIESSADASVCVSFAQTLVAVISSMTGEDKLECSLALADLAAHFAD